MQNNQYSALVGFTPILFMSCYEDDCTDMNNSILNNDDDDDNDDDDYDCDDNDEDDVCHRLFYTALP